MERPVSYPRTNPRPGHFPTEIENFDPRGTTTPPYQVHPPPVGWQGWGQGGGSRRVRLRGRGRVGPRVRRRFGCGRVVGAGGKANLTKSAKNVQDGRWFVWVLTVIGRKRTKNLFAESPNAHHSPPRRVWRPSGVGGYVRGEPLGPPAPWVKCSGRGWRWTSRYRALGSPGHGYFRARRGRYAPLRNLGRGPGRGTG